MTGEMKPIASAYNVLKDVAFKEMDDDPRTPGCLLSAKVQVYVPAIYPAIVACLETLHGEAPQPRICGLQIVDDAKDLYYVANLPILSNPVATSCRRKTLMTMQLPDDVSSVLRVAYTDGDNRYWTLGYLRKERWNWIFGSQKELVVHDAVDLDRPIRIEPFFVGGAPKSGTTWVQDIINSHPDIVCSGEGGFFEYTPWLEKYFRKKDLRDYVSWTLPSPRPRHQVDFVSASLARSVFQYFGAIWGTCKIGDRSPNNALHYRRAISSFQCAKFLHCVRHPLDVAVSRAYHEWSLYRAGKSALISPRLDKEVIDELDSILGKEGYIEPGQLFKNVKFLKTMLREWLKSNEDINRAASEYPTQFLIVRYEDLHNDFQNQAERIFTFLDVDASQEIIDYVYSSSRFETKAGRAPGVEDKSSFFRKGIVGDHHNHFTEEQIRFSRDRLGDTVGKFGYSM
jgi:Sulfotransferase domain